MFGYRVPAPDQAMLISGGRHGPEGAPFRVVIGHGKFILPIFRKVRFLTLAMREAEVAETCVTRQGISVNVRAVIAFKVGNDTESIVNAGQRFLSDQDQMSTLTGRIFAGHLRSIVGSMTVEEIVTERQKLATEVLDGSKAEMAKIGLTVDALQIQSIDDGDTGYIDAMAAPHTAAIQRQAQIAQAQATQAAAEAQQEAQRKQAEYARQTAIVQAQYKAEVDRAQAEAAQAGPLAQAHAQQEVIAVQTELAQREAELRQQQLVAEVVRPAEADAERIRILAQADAERIEIQAEAAASHNRVALDRMLIDQLPQIVKEAAAGLAGAKVSILNGADGISEIAAGLVGQGLTILDSVKENLAASPEIAARAPARRATQSAAKDEPPS
jgi:flotillin